MGGPRRVKQYRTVSQGTARAFVILAILSLLFAAAAGIVAVRAVQGEINSRASVEQLCQAGNDARAQQVTLWTHLIAMSAPPPSQTPAQRQQRAKLITSFLRYVRLVFQQRDCTHLNGG